MDYTFYCYMKKLSILSAAALVLAAAACSSPEKMAQMADNVQVKCEPAVLEVIGGNIDATVTVTYPADYFNPKAILEVTPVIVYKGGEASADVLMYQGEGVKDNYKVVSSKGQSVKEKLHFDYVEGMESCYLELRGNVLAKSKKIALPVKKVADGANTTYMLAKADGIVPLKEDGFKDTYTVSEEGQIIYLVNSSEVRSSELNSQSIKDFQEALKAVSENDKAKVTGTRIVSYASPEGAEDLNNRLSENRSGSASKVWSKVTGGAASPELQSVGEDWEGFQKLVSESNLEDKDLILRVLSMYSDPAVRESEIKNMSEVYTALKGEVLPELRRARLIADVQYSNFTEEELKELLENNEDVLDEAALLHAATLVDNSSKKESVYKKAIDKYDSDRARFNLGVVYLNDGNIDAAEQAFKSVKSADADLSNAFAVIALRRGDYEAAERGFKSSGSDAAKANLGVVYILNGKYDQAVAALEKAPDCFNKALAYVLTDQLDRASASITCSCPRSSYLKAIIAARQGDASAVKSLIEAASKDKDLAKRALTDVEFAGYLN